MFEFTFQMFSRGHATLPARGMAEIPVQLAAKLPPGSIHLSCPVRAVESDGVILESGMLLEADAVVVATDVHTMHRLLPRLEPTERPWRASTTVYFEAPHSPLQEPIVALNGESSGLINNVCVQSDVAPSYAPEGKALVAVSLLGTPSGDDLNTRIRTEARSWFGNGVDTWEHLRTYRIKHSLPEHPPGPTTSSETGFGKHHGIYVCGDHLTSPSIDGAVRSGRLAAEAVLTSRQAVAV
jgi:phytoene dehydrogenase-like protein